jgi:hypothetical protein
MLFPKSIWAAILLASFALAGCTDEPATFTEAGEPRAAATPSGPALTRPHKSHAIAQRNLEDLFLSAYESPEHGVSLLYPRNYALEEGNIVEQSYFLWRQEELDLEQPGATLLATILIPEDAYPNTTFEHGSLQLITEEAWARQACRQTETVAGEESRRLKGITLQSISFEGQENQSLTGGTVVVEREYTGFQNGTCYEFALVVATRDNSDENAKPADVTKIMKQLEKIASSLRISPKPRVPTIRASTEAPGRL